MPLPTLTEQLEDQYFEMLEENGIDYLDYDQVSNDPPHTLTSVKDKHVLTKNQMARELGYKNFKDWKSKQE